MLQNQGFDMFPSISSSDGILFQIPLQTGQEIVHWQEGMDLEIIRDQITRRGSAFVVRLGDDQSLQSITTLPSTGEANPWYGTFGGGYRFVFEASAGGCGLEITNIAAGNGFFRPDPLPPLTVQLSTSIKVGLVDAEIQAGMNDSKPDESGEWFFGITGDLYLRLQGWKWKPEQAFGFRYEFIPLSVGCLIHVEEAETRERFDVTAGVNW